MTTAFSLVIPLGIPSIAVASKPEETTAVVSGTLLKMIVDFAPQSQSSRGPFTRVLGGSQSLKEAQGSLTADESHHEETILHAVQVGQTTLPIKDTEQLLTDVQPGSEVTVELKADLTDIASPASDATSPLSEQATQQLAQAEAPVLTYVLRTSNPPSDSSTTGNHQVFVAIPATADQGSAAPPTADAARKLIADASTYWREQTYNQLTGFRIARTSQYTSALSRKTMCDLESSSSMLRIWSEAARQTGYKPGARKHLVVLTGDCKTSTGAQNSALGVAEIGANLSTGGRSIVNDSSLQTLVHELGHNFSLGHSNLESVYRDAQIPYFGMYSPMAATVSAQLGSIPALDIAYQHKLGVLPRGSIKPVIGSQTVTLSPMSQRAGTRGAYFHLPTTGQKIYIEYRSGTLSESNAFYLSSGLDHEIPGFRFGPGVRVYSLTENGIETNNDTGTFAREGRRDPANSNQLNFLATLRQGESLQHFVSGFKIRATSISAQSASIAVSIPKAVTSLSSAKKSVAYGSNAKLRVLVESTVPTGGSITAYRDGKKVGSAKVSARAGSQVVTVKLKNNLPVGKNKIKLKYSGSASAYGKSRNTYVTVKRAKPKVSVKVIEPYVKYSTKLAITASSGRIPTGKATVFLDGKKLKTVTLKKGAANVALPKGLRTGKHTITVKYSGTSRYRPVTKKAAFTVSRKVGKISGFTTGKQTVRIGKTYSDRFRVNDAAVIQKRSGSRWITVRKLKAGTHTFKHAATKSGTRTKYRVLIKGSNRLTGTHSKSLTITNKK